MVIQATVTALAAVVLLSAAFEGYLWRMGTLRIWARIGFGVGGLLLFIPEAYTDIVGAALALTVAVITLILGRRATGDARTRG